MKMLLRVIVATALLLGSFNLVHVSAADVIGFQIAPQYSSVQNFSEGLAAVKKADGKWGFIDKNGAEKIAAQYDEVKPLKDGVIIVKVNNQWGLINKAGKVIVAPQYDSYADYDRNGVAKVSKNKKFGYVNRAGNVVVGLTYDKLYGFSEGLSRFERGGKDGFLDVTGKEVIPPQFRRSELFGDNYFREGLTGVTDANASKYYQLKFIDKLGNQVISPYYESTGGFSDGLASVCVRTNHIDYCGYITSTGYERIPLQYAQAYDFNDGIALVNKRTSNRIKYGFIDKTGKEIVALQYDGAYEFQEGLAAVVKADKLGFINKQGTVVIPFIYDHDSDDRQNYYFKDGLVKLSMDGKYGYVNAQGKQVIPMKYNYLGAFSENLVEARAESESGYLDRSGQVVVRFKYWGTREFSEGLAAVRSNGGWGFIAKPSVQTAVPTSANVTLNGKKVDIEAYNIKGSNYFKLRDIAMLLKDTEKRFSITWDANANGISMESGEAYTPAGGELSKSAKLTAKSGQPSVSNNYLNGVEIELTAYNIAGSNYFKLVDLGISLNFQVNWNAKTSTVLIDTTEAAQ